MEPEILRREGFVNRWVLSLEWKTKGVIVGERKSDDSDEVNQEESEQNAVDGRKKEADSTGKVMHMWKSGWWFVMRKIRVVELKWQQMTSEFYT